MPLYTRKRVFAAKIEATVGTAISLSGSDGVFNAFDTICQPTAEFIKRVGQGAIRHLEGVVGQRSATMSFKTELYGDGAGGVPTWASTLLPACGWVNSAGTFSPRLEAPGSNVKTLTMGCYTDGMFKSIRGAVGNFKVIFDVGNPIMLEWTFTGAWVPPTDVALIAPTYPTRKPIKAAAGVFSLGSWAPSFKTFTLESGNVIAVRPDVNDTTGAGIHSYCITDREPLATFDPEANLVATSNADVYGDWLAAEEDTFSLAVEDAADTITFASSKVQRTSVQEADRDGLQIDNIGLKFNDSSGNDSLTIAFAVNS